MKEELIKSAIELLKSDKIFSRIFSYEHGTRSTESFLQYLTDNNREKLIVKEPVRVEAIKYYLAVAKFIYEEGSIDS